MQLDGLKRKLKRRGYRWALTPNDEAALLEGCWFDPQAAQHVCDSFTTFLRHSKGEWSGQPFDLLEWQVELLSKLVGFKRADGTRRFRQLGCWVPKKNGKSTLAAAFTLYMLLADGEAGAEVYSCASSTQQAAIIFNEAKAMVEASPKLRSYIEVIPPTKRLVFPRTRSYYQVLSSNSATAQGWNIHAVFL